MFGRLCASTYLSLSLSFSVTLRRVFLLSFATGSLCSAVRPLLLIVLGVGSRPRFPQSVEFQTAVACEDP